MRNLVIIACGVIAVVAGLVAVAGGLAWAGRTRTPDHQQFWPTDGGRFVAIGEDAEGPAYVMISYLPIEQVGVRSKTSSRFGATSAVMRLTVDGDETAIPMRRHPLLIVVLEDGELQISNLSDSRVSEFQNALKEVRIVNDRIPLIEVAERVLLHGAQSPVSREE